MDVENAKSQLKVIFGNQVVFNKEFNIRFLELKVGMQQDLINWCIDCKEGKSLGSVPPLKQYKDYYVFFRKIANNVRAVVIKKQNSDFIEVILDTHNAYDKKRQELGYKKSSYYGS